MNIFSTIGLLTDIVGVIFLFIYGLPSKVKEHGGGILLEEQAKDELDRQEKNKKIKRRSYFGLTLILIGFITQLIGSNIGYFSSSTIVADILVADPLIGKWENSSGLRIEVIKKGATFNGVIIQSSDISSVGEMKWYNIKKIEENKYETENLVHYWGGDIPRGQFEVDYLLTYLELINQNEIQTHFINKSFIKDNKDSWKRIIEISSSDSSTSKVESPR